MSRTQAVSIHDRRGGFLAVDLIDVLRLVESDAAASTWVCRNVECTGGTAAELHRADDAGTRLTGHEMLRLAAGVQQVIDGDFAAFRVGDTRPWLILRAVDSSCYVAITEDEQLLHRLRERYQDVRPSPADADIAATAFVAAHEAPQDTSMTLEYAGQRTSSMGDRRFWKAFVVCLCIFAPLTMILTFLSEYAAGMSAFGARPSEPLPLGRFPLPGGAPHRAPWIWGLNCLFWAACLSLGVAFAWTKRAEIKRGVAGEKRRRHG